MNEQATVRALYRRLLAFYPREFRDRLGEPMEQTFQDLWNERRQTKRELFGFVFWTFIETAIGIFREHLLLLSPGDLMQNTLKSLGSSGLFSLLIILPFMIMEVVNRRNFVVPIESVLTIDGSQPSALGYTIICGGLLLLPIAFLINLRPLLRRDETDGKRKFYGLNLFVGVILSLLLIFTWGGLILEEIYCLRGIRCD